mmetsp:Transcript_19616/g.29725  ORF Transcript_19616/g.29725 Transcript_19616/m.29725 type:complete len:91 (+) Transcript_19616:9-281(+)
MTTSIMVTYEISGIIDVVTYLNATVVNTRVKTHACRSPKSAGSSAKVANDKKPTIAIITMTFHKMKLGRREIVMAKYARQYLAPEAESVD